MRLLRAGFRASSLRGRPLRVGEKSQPALFTFIDGLSAGQVAEYSLPSLTVSVSGKGTPFGPSPDASAGPFDWMCYLPWDPTTKRLIAAGGRAAATATATKIMIFDAEANEAYSYVNPWGVGTGHIYQSPVVIEEHRRFFFRSFHTGALLLWDIDAETAVSSLPAVPGTYRLGENPAFAWFPDWGTQGSLVVVGRDVDTSGVIVGRYDWALAAWQSPVYVSGLGGFGPLKIRPDVDADGSNTDHPAGCYVPAASAGIFGNSTIWDNKPLLVVPSGGGTPYWTATACPAGVSALYPGGPQSGSLGLMTPHPSRAALVLISRADTKAYTYEFGSDTYVDRGTAPSVYGLADSASANQGITTIVEKGALVSLHGSAGQAADEMWVWKVGTALG